MTGKLTQVGGKFYGAILGVGSGSLFEYDPTAGTLTILHTFNSIPADGAAPVGGVFEYNLKSHSESLLYSFAGGADGSSPQGGLIQGSGGVLYGMTYAGGANDVGTIFALAVQ